jgi:hypothetical protein
MINKTKNIDNQNIKVKNIVKKLMDKKIKVQKKNNLYKGGLLPSRSEEEVAKSNELEEEKKKKFLEKTNKENFKFDVHLDDIITNAPANEKKTLLSNMARTGKQIKDNLTKTFRREGLIEKTEEEEKEEKEEEKKETELKNLKDTLIILTQGAFDNFKEEMHNFLYSNKILKYDQETGKHFVINEDILKNMKTENFEKIMMLLSQANFNKEEIIKSNNYTMQYLNSTDNTYEDLYEAQSALKKERFTLNKIRLPDILEAFDNIQKIYDQDIKEREESEESKESGESEESKDDDGNSSGKNIIIVLPSLDDNISIANYILAYFDKEGQSQSENGLLEIKTLYDDFMTLLHNKYFIEINNDNVTIKDIEMNKLSSDTYEGQLNDKDLEDTREGIEIYINLINDEIKKIRKKLMMFIDNINEEKSEDNQQWLIRYFKVDLDNCIFELKRYISMLMSYWDDAFKPSSVVYVQKKTQKVPESADALMAQIERRTKGSTGNWVKSKSDPKKKPTPLKTVEAGSHFANEFLKSAEGRRRLAKIKEENAKTQAAFKKSKRGGNVGGGNDGTHTKYKSTGESVYILYKNRKYKRVIYLKAKKNTKYCKINNEYILLSKLKIIDL